MTILVRVQKEKRRATESLGLLREYLSNREENFGRKTHGKWLFEVVSDKNEEHTGNWREGDFCYKVVKSLAELYGLVFVEHRTCKEWNWINWICSWSYFQATVEDVAWLVTAHSKTQQEDKNDIKTDIITLRSRVSTNKFREGHKYPIHNSLPCPHKIHILLTCRIHSLYHNSHKGLNLFQ